MRLWDEMHLAHVAFGTVPVAFAVQSRVLPDVTPAGGLKWASLTDVGHATFGDKG